MVGTDPDYALTATDGSLDRFYDWVTRSYYRQVGGHVTHWGRRPAARRHLGDSALLHNGSVPDLRALLDSPLRPEFWRHHLHPRACDPTVLGWEYERLQHGKSAVAEPDAKARVSTQRFRAMETAVTSSETT